MGCSSTDKEADGGWSSADSDGLLSEAEYVDAGSLVRANGGVSELYATLGITGIQNLGADFCRYARSATSNAEAGSAFAGYLRSQVPGDEAFALQMYIFGTIAAQYMCIDILLSIS